MPCFTAALLILGSLGAAATHEQHSACDRKASREVRNVVHQFILPYTADVKYSLPQQCPLNPSLDRFLDQERSKSAQVRGQWKCSICGKLFHSEEHIDKHMANRHADRQPQNSSVCLADLHTLLHTRQLKAYQEGEVARASEPAPSRRSILERRREDCLALAAACFPANDSRPAQLLHDYFAGHVCKAHTSDGKRRRALLKVLTQAYRKKQGFWSVWVVLTLGLIGLFYLFLFIIYTLFDSELDSATSSQRTSSSDESLSSWLGKSKSQ